MAKKDTFLSLRIPTELKKQIKVEADKQHQSINAFVIMLVMKYLRGERE